MPLHVSEERNKARPGCSHIPWASSSIRCLGRPIRPPNPPGTISRPERSQAVGYTHTNKARRQEKTLRCCGSPSVKERNPDGIQNGARALADCGRKNS